MDSTGDFMRNSVQVAYFPVKYVIALQQDLISMKNGYINDLQRKLERQERRNSEPTNNNWRRREFRRSTTEDCDFRETPPPSQPRNQPRNRPGNQPRNMQGLNRNGTRGNHSRARQCSCQH